MVHGSIDEYYAVMNSGSTARFCAPGETVRGRNHNLSEPDIVKPNHRYVLRYSDMGFVTFSHDM